MAASKKRPSISRVSRKPLNKRGGKNLYTLIPEDTMPREPEHIARHIAPEVVVSSQLESLLTALVASLRGQEESLSLIATHLGIIAARPACGTDKPVKVRAPKATPVEVAEPVVEEALPCCGARKSSGIHKSDCSVAYPKAPPVPTYDEVRAAALAFAQKHGKAALVEVLQKYNPEGKITAVPEDKRSALISALAVQE